MNLNDLTIKLLKYLYFNSFNTLPGSIELKEMIDIIGTLYEMEGSSKVRKNPNDLSCVLTSQISNDHSNFNFFCQTI